MKAFNVDISKMIRKHLPIDAFVFNPSLAWITGELYLLSVRAYTQHPKEKMDENPELLDNHQHPWGTGWDGRDVTYIFMLRINDKISVIANKYLPITIPVQDMRIFRFMELDGIVSFILTFNERYEDQPNIMIKGGDHCDDWCYLVGWAYLTVDISKVDQPTKMTISYVPGKEPLCPNISNPIDKNWSLWTYETNRVNLALSYLISPAHSIFTFKLLDVRDGEIIGGTDCRMLSKSKNEENFFAKLEKYYEGNLMVSLSTPAYQVSKRVYQAVGHIKVRLPFMKKIARDEWENPLGRFAQSHITRKENVHFSPTYMYFTYIYRFQLVPATAEELEDSGAFFTISNKTRLTGKIISVTPAFILQPQKYNYYLNFASGMVLEKDRTIISYGDGDAASELLFIDNSELEDYLIPVEELKPNKFRFVMAKVHDDGVVNLR